MISGRNPWRCAIVKDDCFAAYLHDRDFLRRVLPISLGANDILKRIFHINPLCRISLMELRKEILALDTFFLTDEELMTGPIRALSDTFNQSQATLTNDSLSGTSVDDSDADASASSDEIYAFNSPPDDHLSPSETLNTPGHVDSAATSPSLSAEASCASSSGSDSFGPITPATHPIDPAVEVPDLPEGESLAQSTICPVTNKVLLATQHESTVQVLVPKRRHLLRKAFERIMIHTSDSQSS